MKGKWERKYTVFQNSVFMLSVAWKKRRSLLWSCLGIVIVAILLSLTQLFVLPVILDAIENAVPVGRLIIIIAFLSAMLIVLSGFNSYLYTCTIFKRIEVRLHIGTMIQEKSLTMSFPDIENQDVRKKMDKAVMLVSNTTAATEAIWGTLTDLLKNGAEFVICFSIFTMLNPFLIFIVLITTVISFLLSNYLNGWGYRHRDEEAEYSRRMNYLSEKSRDYTYAKDVRIFGMRNWIEEVYESALQLIRNFSARGERIYLLGDIANVLFT